jgi:hypothetical protein
MPGGAVAGNAAVTITVHAAVKGGSAVCAAVALLRLVLLLPCYVAPAVLLTLAMLKLPVVMLLPNRIAVSG